MTGEFRFNLRRVALHPHSRLTSPLTRVSHRLTFVLRPSTSRSDSTHRQTRREKQGKRGMLSILPPAPPKRAPNAAPAAPAAHPEVNLLPCRIHHTGSANAHKSHLWSTSCIPASSTSSPSPSPQSSSSDGTAETLTKVAYFRGRRLLGRSIALPAGYTGLHPPLFPRLPVACVSVRLIVIPDL